MKPLLHRTRMKDDDKFISDFRYMYTSITINRAQVQKLLIHNFWILAPKDMLIYRHFTTLAWVLYTTLAYYNVLWEQIVTHECILWWHICGSIVQNYYTISVSVRYIIIFHDSIHLNIHKLSLLGVL